jgi:hypothetical protein
VIAATASGVSVPVKAPTCHPVRESAGGDVGEDERDRDQGQRGELPARWHAGGRGGELGVVLFRNSRSVSLTLGNPGHCLNGPLSCASVSESD